MDTAKLMKKHQDVTIVLVEDDAGHALLIEKNLRRAGIVNTIKHCADGQAAVDHFFGPSYRPEGPQVVLLDLNLPVLDGTQVLARLKGNEQTRSIPVVILTTTDSPHEVERCYDLGCNVYITKPVEYEQFADAMRRLGMFLSIVQLPEAKRPHG